MKNIFCYFLIILLFKIKSKKDEYTINLFYQFDDKNSDNDRILFENIKIFKGSIFSNYPRKSSSTKSTFGKFENEKFTPWPNDEYNSNDGNCSKFISIVNFEFDEDNNIYLLDEGSSNCPIKLYKFNSEGIVLENYTIYNRASNIDTLNVSNFVIDTTNDYIYIAYSNLTKQQENAGIFILKLKDQNTTAKALTLNGQNFLIDENYISPITNNIKFVNIALSCDGKYIIFCPLSSKMFYSIPTKKIREESVKSISFNDVNAAYKNDLSSSLISGNLGNLYLTGLEKNAIYIAEQIDYELSFFDFKILEKIENKYEPTEKPNKIFIDDGDLYIVYKNTSKKVNNTRIYKTFIDNENSYINKCDGLKYNLKLSSEFIWIFILLIIIYILFIIYIENKQDRDINKKK